MRPPPLPAHVFTGDRKRELTPALSTTSDGSTTNPEEAQLGIEDAYQIPWRNNRQWGFDTYDFVQMGRLMEKLKVQQASSA